MKVVGVRNVLSENKEAKTPAQCHLLLSSVSGFTATLKILLIMRRLIIEDWLAITTKMLPLWLEPNFARNIRRPLLHQ